MNSSSGNRMLCFAVLGTVLACLVLSATVSAQDTSATNTSQSGAASVTTEVKSAEVIYVSGNDLVVKADDGQIKHFVVPDDKTVTVDGKELTVHDLQPGMRLTRTITTTSTPTTITTVRTIRGKVWHVNPPNSVILTLSDGNNKQYKIPKGQMFEMDGQKYDAFALKKGMNVSATVMTETPQTVVTSARNVTGQAPPPPPTPPQTGALLIEDTTPAPAPEAPTEVAQAALPKTGSSIPLIGLVGLLCLSVGFALRSSRV